MNLCCRVLVYVVLFATFLPFSARTEAEERKALFAPSEAVLQNENGIDYKNINSVKKGNILEVDGQLLSAYTSLKYNCMFGSSFYKFGRIANVPERGYVVEGESSNYFFGYARDNYQFNYVKQFYALKKQTPRGFTSARRNASIYKLTYDFGFKGSSSQNRFAVGSLFYIDGKNRFSQPFALASFGSERARASIGVNWTTGSAPFSGAAAFGAAQIALTPQLGLFADYSGGDFQKTIVNGYLLPSVGVGCTGCSRDALTVGGSMNLKRAFRLSQRGAPAHTVISGSYGVYDVRDLKAPFGTLLINMEL